MSAAAIGALVGESGGYSQQYLLNLFFVSYHPLARPKGWVNLLTMRLVKRKPASGWNIRTNKMALPSNLFMRDDTLLGVCEGLGQDLGINPLWIRLAFLPALFFFPAATIGLYILLGAIVFAARRLFPAPQAVTAPLASHDASASEPSELPLAA
jgi:phage shock protein C